MALIQLRHINPLPNDLGDIMDQFKLIILAELNSGQLCQVLRSRYLKDIRSINQCNGQSFATHHLLSEIRDLTHEIDNLHP